MNEYSWCFLFSPHSFESHMGILWQPDTLLYVEHHIARIPVSKNLWSLFVFIVNPEGWLKDMQCNPFLWSLFTRDPGRAPTPILSFYDYTMILIVGNWKPLSSFKFSCISSFSQLVALGRIFQVGHQFSFFRLGHFGWSERTFIALTLVPRCTCVRYSAPHCGPEMPVARE